ncbi:MAG: rhodanese-like domain-containing protein [Bacteroidia bacterium]
MITKLKKMLGIGPKTDLAALIASGALIVDVRTKGEYAAGHVKGSVNIPLDQIESNLKKFKSKDQVIITCCASGMRSASAKGILSRRGFQNVHNGGSWHKVEQYCR